MVAGAPGVAGEGVVRLVAGVRSSGADSAPALHRDIMESPALDEACSPGHAMYTRAPLVCWNFHVLFRAVIMVTYSWDRQFR